MRLYYYLIVLLHFDINVLTETYINHNTTTVIYPCLQNITMTKVKDEACFEPFTDAVFFSAQQKAKDWVTCKNISEWKLWLSWQAKGAFCDFLNHTDKIVELHHSKNTSFKNKTLLYRFSLMTGIVPDNGTFLVYFYFKTGTKPKTKTPTTIPTTTPTTLSTTSTEASTAMCETTTITTTSNGPTFSSVTFSSKNTEITPTIRLKTPYEMSIYLAQQNTSLIGFNKMGLFCFDTIFIFPGFLFWFIVIFACLCIKANKNITESDDSEIHNCNCAYCNAQGVHNCNCSYCSWSAQLT